MGHTYTKILPIVYLVSFFSFSLCMATPAACGNSQDLTRATAVTRAIAVVMLPP